MVLTSCEHDNDVLERWLLKLQMHRVVIHTFERRVSKPYVWKSKTLEFHTAVGSALHTLACLPSFMYCM